MSIEIKICGLTSLAAVTTAVDAGADMIGFVFFPKSPRHMDVADATELAKPARGRSRIVALVVDPTDGQLVTLVDGLKPDLLQLHGSESPQRAAEIARLTGVGVMKALKIATSADLAPIDDFRPHVDRFLFDAKAPPSLENALPGGNGISFDWRLVAGLNPGRPAMLSGGLHAGNVGEAIRLTGTSGVDVSSGVEARPGEKDPDRIKAFIAAVRGAL